MYRVGLENWSHGQLWIDRLHVSSVLNRRTTNGNDVVYTTLFIVKLLARLSVECRDVPRVCRRRRAERAATDCLVPAAVDRRRCSRRTASYQLPRRRSSGRPTGATAERARTTNDLDLHHVAARTRNYNQ